MRPLPDGAREVLAECEHDSRPAALSADAPWSDDEWSAWQKLLDEAGETAPPEDEILAAEAQEYRDYGPGGDAIPPF